MSIKYTVLKMKGVFYAGSNKIAEQNLKLKKYLNLQDVINMAKALQLSAQSILFKGLSKGEQKKIISASAGAKMSAAKKTKKKTKAKRRK